MTRYKDELFHYSTKPSAAQLLRKKKRAVADEDAETDDEQKPKKKLSRRQLLLQALQKNQTKVGTDSEEPDSEEPDEENDEQEDLSPKPKRKKLASKNVKGKPRFPLKKAAR